METGKLRPVRYNEIEGLDADKVNAALDEYIDRKGSELYHVRMKN
jgi:NADPH2:quinone reductase